MKTITSTRTKDESLSSKIEYYENGYIKSNLNIDEMKRMYKTEYEYEYNEKYGIPLSFTQKTMGVDSFTIKLFDSNALHV